MVAVGFAALSLCILLSITASDDAKWVSVLVGILFFLGFFTFVPGVAMWLWEVAP